MTLSSDLHPRIRAFVAALISSHPEWEELVEQTVDSHGCPTAKLEVVGPSGKDSMRLLVFFDVDDPSVGLGAWHTHASLFPAASDAERDQALLALIEEILHDRLILLRDVDPPTGTASVVEACDEDEILDYVTSPYAPLVVAVESWSGGLDREYTTTVRPIEHGL